MASAATVNDVLGGHVGLDLECLDRIYLNGYVPTLQVPGQVFTFLTRHLGKPIASPAVFEQIGGRFRRAMSAFAKMTCMRDPLSSAHAWCESAGQEPEEVS